MREHVVELLGDARPLLVGLAAASSSRDRLTSASAPGDCASLRRRPARPQQAAITSPASTFGPPECPSTHGNREHHPARLRPRPREHPLPGETSQDDRKPSDRRVRAKRIARARRTATVTTNTTRAPRTYHPAERREQDQAPAHVGTGVNSVSRSHATPPAAIRARHVMRPPPPDPDFDRPQNTARRTSLRRSCPTGSQPHDNHGPRVPSSAPGAGRGFAGGSTRSGYRKNTRSRHRSRPSPDDKSPAGEHAAALQHTTEPTDRRSNDVRVRHDQPDDPGPQPARERRRPRRHRRPAAPAPHRRTSTRRNSRSAWTGAPPRKTVGELAELTRDLPNDRPRHRAGGRTGFGPLGYLRVIPIVPIILAIVAIHLIVGVASGLWILIPLLFVARFMFFRRGFGGWSGRRGAAL